MEQIGKEKLENLSGGALLSIYLSRPVTDEEARQLLSDDSSLEELAVRVGWGAAKRIKSFQEYLRRHAHAAY